MDWSDWGILASPGVEDFDLAAGDGNSYYLPIYVADICIDSLIDGKGWIFAGAPVKGHLLKRRLVKCATSHRQRGHRGVRDY
jgi:hypothetical protein